MPSNNVQRYRETSSVLKSQAPVVPLGAASPSGLDEPVMTTAPMAKMVAPVLCRVDRDAGESCSWYHGFWQYLRLFKLAPTPEKHTGFFLDALGSLARDGEYGRMLISGAADYCMLAHVMRAYRNNDSRAEITVDSADSNPQNNPPGALLSTGSSTPSRASAWGTCSSSCSSATTRLVDHNPRAVNLHAGLFSEEAL